MRCSSAVLRFGKERSDVRCGVLLHWLVLVAILLVPVVALGADSPRPRVSRYDAGTNGVFSRAMLRGLNYPVSAKILRYAERVVKEHDANGDGRLEKDEWATMKGDPEQIDLDRDRQITVDEFARYIAKYGRSHRIHLVAPPSPAYVETPPALFQPAAEAQASTEPEPSSEADDEEEEDEWESMFKAPSDRPLRRKSSYQQKFYIPRASLPTGLPEWFVQRDLDGDGQVSMAEFAPNGGRVEAAEFLRYDTNRDGMITPQECLQFGKGGKSLTRKTQ